MTSIPPETCSSYFQFPVCSMTFGCNIERVLNYDSSVKDCWINYATLLLTLSTLVLCTWRAGDVASRFPQTAPWFWVPFTLVLFGLQILADCSTDNVGISAVWSAYAGFISLGSYRMGTLWSAGGRAVAFATTASVAVWVVVCVYYAVVEEAMTTVAHLVAFGVGANALLLFEALHRFETKRGYKCISGTNESATGDSLPVASR